MKNSYISKITNDDEQWTERHWDSAELRAKGTAEFGESEEGFMRMGVT